MAEGMITIDPNITIGGEHPIQGSVSLSVDESEIVVARYEGGTIAGVGGRLKYSLKYQTFGADGSGGFSQGSVELSTSSGSLTITDAVITTTVGWSSELGFVTDHIVNGYGPAAS